MQVQFLLYFQTRFFFSLDDFIFKINFYLQSLSFCEVELLPINTSIITRGKSIHVRDTNGVP